MLRIFQFLVSIVILGIFSYFLAEQSRNGKSHRQSLFSDNNGTGLLRERTGVGLDLHSRLHQYLEREENVLTRAFRHYNSHLGEGR